MSWMPPAHVSDARTRIRLYKALVDKRTGRLQWSTLSSSTMARLRRPGSPAVS